MRSALFIMFIFCGSLYAQKTPKALRSDIVVSKLIDVKPNAIRIAYDAASDALYYNTAEGDIYRLLQDSTGSFKDSLVYTTSDHGIEYLMGMFFRNGWIYLSGNNMISDPYTSGLLVKGTPPSSGNRTWTTIARIGPYQTADVFDHLMSGLVMNPSGDSILLCNAARGDHGEVQTRNGQFPGLRNPPLTTLVLRIPVDTHDLVLKNDSLWLASSGFVYARGARNYFDMAYCANGDLFALENSGDRDHNEEMNWLRYGKHYGFPWKMGRTYNPVGKAGYDPATDIMLPVNSYARSLGAFYYDQFFPKPPAGIVFSDPVFNLGPDADKYRDSVSGKIMDASDRGESLQTFTAHRSPLGLVFDNDSLLIPEFRGHAFMLSYTKGLDSAHSLPPPDNFIGPFLDPSEDLIHLALEKNAANDNYVLKAKRIVEDFNSPVDAEIVGTDIYVLENKYTGNPALWKIHMPAWPLRTEEIKTTQPPVLYPNPLSGSLYLRLDHLFPSEFSCELINPSGAQLLVKNCSRKASEETLFVMDTSTLTEGIYFLVIHTAERSYHYKLLVIPSK